MMPKIKATPKISLTMHVEPDLNEQIEERARELGVSKSEAVRMAMRYWLKAQETA